MVFRGWTDDVTLADAPQQGPRIPFPREHRLEELFAVRVRDQAQQVLGLDRGCDRDVALVLLAQQLDGARDEREEGAEGCEPTRRDPKAIPPK